jgi:hypothetical protein
VKWLTVFPTVTAYTSTNHQRMATESATTQGQDRDGE